jgi:hypothetical protein
MFSNEDIRLSHAREIAQMKRIASSHPTTTKRIKLPSGMTGEVEVKSSWKPSKIDNIKRVWHF